MQGTGTRFNRIFDSSSRVIIETMLAIYGSCFFQTRRNSDIPSIGGGGKPETAGNICFDVPVRANYSSEEVGMIGSECEKIPEITMWRQAT